MIKYPDKPWVDKQTFTHTTQAGDEIAGIYDAPTNTWSFYKGTADVVFTNTVYTVDIRPAADAVANAAALFNDALPLPQPDALVTQQDVNWYLYDLISNLEGSSAVWIGAEEPPNDSAGVPLFKFWWKEDESELYVWDELATDWKLTGLMDFDRPPIVSELAPLEHPKFPGEPLEQGDFWYSTARLEMFIYWMGEWFPTTAPPADYDVEIESFGYELNRVKALLDEIYLKNIQQDDRLTEIENDIIELEEEIEALAPSLERGQWNYKQILENRAYSLFDSSGQTTDMFNNVASIYVSTIDSNGNPHGFDDVVAGSYVEIFNDTDADFGLYVVKDVDDKSNMNPGYWIFTVDFIKSNRLPSKANGLARFKFFEAPTGGDISDLAPPTPTFLATPPLRIHSVDNVPFNLSPNAGEIQPLGRFTTQSAEDFYISDTKYYRISKDIFEETFPDGIENYTFMPGQMLFYGAAHQQSAAGSHPSNQGIYMAINFQLVNDRYYEITVNGTAGVIQDPAFKDNKYLDKSTYKHFLSFGCFWRNS